MFYSPHWCKGYIKILVKLHLHSKHNVCVLHCLIVIFHSITIFTVFDQINAILVSNVIIIDIINIIKNIILAAEYVIVIKYLNAAFSGQIYLYNDC